MSQLKRTLIILVGINYFVGLIFSEFHVENHFFLLSLPGIKVLPDQNILTIKSI